MKIGILTFHSALNVGAVLQAYALQSFLENKGYETEFIDYSHKRKYTLKDFVAKGITKTLFKWQNLFLSVYFSRVSKFNSILKLSEKKYVSIEELNQRPPKCDVYVAGSDQIWNPGSKGKVDDVYLLNFGDKNAKRISFAASLGQGVISKEFENYFRDKLLAFDYISIREQKGYNYIKELLPGKEKIFKISDPTFLLKADDYCSLIETKTKHRKYMVSYILWHFETDQKMSLNYIKSKLNLKHINLRNPDTGERFWGAKNIVVKPQDWLNWVFNSEFIICCSFHIVVFSLIFHKPFVVLTNKENVRIQSLLEPLGLDYRIITKYEEEKIDVVLSEKIDWGKVDEYFISEREKGIYYLKESLV